MSRRVRAFARPVDNLSTKWAFDLYDGRGRWLETASSDRLVSRTLALQAARARMKVLRALPRGMISLPIYQEGETSLINLGSTSGLRSLKREPATRPNRYLRVRKKLDITQQRMAALLHVTFQTVNRWENGRHTPQGLRKAIYGVLDSELRAGKSPRKILFGTRHEDIMDAARLFALARETLYP